MNYGSNSSYQTPVKLARWKPGQEEVFNLLSSRVKGGMATPIPRYPGELYAPETPEESAYLEATRGELPNAFAPRQAALEQILSGRVPYGVGPEWAERFFEEGIRPEALREQEQVTLPRIKEAFVGPGYWGSDRAQAESKSAQDLATKLATAKSSLMYQEELAKRAAQEGALKRQAMTALPAYEGGVEGLARGAALSRTIEQEKNAAQFNRWLMGEEVEGIDPVMYSPYTQLAFQLLGLSPYAFGQTGTSRGSQFGIA